MTQLEKARKEIELNKDVMLVIESRARIYEMMLEVVDKEVYDLVFNKFLCQ